MRVHTFATTVSTAVCRTRRSSTVRVTPHHGSAFRCLFTCLTRSAVARDLKESSCRTRRFRSRQLSSHASSKRLLNMSSRLRNDVKCKRQPTSDLSTDCTFSMSPSFRNRSSFLSLSFKFGHFLEQILSDAEYLDLRNPCVYCSPCPC